MLIENSTVGHRPFLVNFCPAEKQGGLLISACFCGYNSLECQADEVGICLARMTGYGQPLV